MNMRRRRFLEGCSTSLGALLTAARGSPTSRATAISSKRARAADLVIIGGGLGGCAAALAALRNGRSVILTEPTDWIGGQLTAQAVPPDEHPWIEQFGASASYQALRQAIRDEYRRYYPLTESARSLRSLNPGNGGVSRLCHEPRAALAALTRRRREVLVLRYYVGLSEAEIAATLGISPGTVKSTAARGLAALARALRETR